MTGFWLLPVIGISFILTAAVEITFALAAGIRTKKDLLLVFLANLLTNPAVVLLYYLAAYHTAWAPEAIKLSLEITAVLAEAYCYMIYSVDIRRPFLFSFVANLISFSIGAIAGRIM